jgi:hypothetical protein
MQDHLPLYPIVLCTPVPPYTAGPSKMTDSIKEDDLNCMGALVAGAGKIDDEAGMPIYTAMDVEAPWTQLLIAILVP